MIQQDVMAILEACTVNEHTVKLPPEQLERKLFERVDSVLENLGGKWKGNRKLYEFPYDPATMLQTVIETGEEPPKNPHAFFPTPPAVLDVMFDVLEHRSPERILEPSAGTGAIACKLRESYPEAEIEVCEFQSINRHLLEQQGFNVVAEDFLSHTPSEQYDMIVMNPPFSVEGDKNAWLTHFEHAWSMLKPFGDIVCITPLGWTFRSDKKSQNFKQFVYDALNFDILPPQSFKDSGTLVDTAFVYGRKDAKPWRREPCEGWGSWHAFQIAITIENDWNLLTRAREAKNAADIMNVAAAAVRELKEIDPSTPIYVHPDDMQELFEHFQTWE